MQNDFASPGGMFDRAGIPIDAIQALIEPTRRAIAGRGAAMHIVFLKMQFAADLSDAGAPGTPNRLKHQPLQIGDAMVTPDGIPGQILVEEGQEVEKRSDEGRTPSLAAEPHGPDRTQATFAPFLERRPGGAVHRPTNDNAALEGAARLKYGSDGTRTRDSYPMPTWRSGSSARRSTMPLSLHTREVAGSKRRSSRPCCR